MRRKYVNIPANFLLKSIKGVMPTLGITMSVAGYMIMLSGNFIFADPGSFSNHVLNGFVKIGFHRTRCFYLRGFCA